jgi:hypothetical protein
MRTKGSVPNVKRAMREGAAGRAAIQSKVSGMSRSTEATKQKRDNRMRGLRGPS